MTMPNIHTAAVAVVLLAIKIPALCLRSYYSLRVGAGLSCDARHIIESLIPTAEKRGVQAPVRP